MVNTVSGIPCGLIALLPRQVKSVHYDNTSMQYTAIIHGCKNGNFQTKSDIFSYFCSKTEIVGTRENRHINEYRQSMF